MGMNPVTTEEPLPPPFKRQSPPFRIKIKTWKQQLSAFPRRLATRQVVVKATGQMSSICGDPGAKRWGWEGRGLKNKKHKAVVNEDRKKKQASWHMTALQTCWGWGATATRLVFTVWDLIWAQLRSEHVGTLTLYGGAGVMQLSRSTVELHWARFRHVTCDPASFFHLVQTVASHDLHTTVSKALNVNHSFKTCK